MPKKNVPLQTGELYHLYNRGVDKRDIYLDKADYLRFYQSLAYFNAVEATVNFRLAKAKNKTNNSKLVEIQAYCLLPNHYHLIVKQIADGGVSEFMKRLSAGYTGYFNEKYERVGSLFQGPFKRVHVNSDEQYRYLFAYVNENHSVHNLSVPTEICYSSTLHYQKRATSNLITYVTAYQHTGAVALARSIYQKRSAYKEILE